MKGSEKQIRRRSSKACDQCRKSKCKCERGSPQEPCKNCVLLGTRKFLVYPPTLSLTYLQFAFGTFTQNRLTLKRQRCTTYNSTRLLACTFLGPSRKRGPPKGYIDAIEARLHQTEALIGILLASKDSRAKTLLEDLSQVRSSFHLSSAPSREARRGTAIITDVMMGVLATCPI